MEDNRFIDAIEKFGAQMFFQFAAHMRFNYGIGLALLGHFQNSLGANIAGHHNNGVGEINGAALAIG